ncbi:MAG: hypothetical protein MUE69_31935, partial [Myxococcota bacterium]|nr:hypothetical protein [Myxococcota bacterium]
MEPSLSHFGALASELGADDFDAAVQWFQGEATPEPEWREFSEKLGQRSAIQEHAMRVIRAEREKVAPSQADIDALTAHVLDVPAVRLALDIRAGGPWALSRTLELARLILASPPSDKD